jgi:probable O-glycosylation ligase (exosortase A-associated)
MTIPLLYYLYNESQRKFVRWGLIGAMLLTGLAAFGTHSRGALLGMGAMGAMLWWKSRQKFLIAFLSVVGVASVYMFMPQEWFDRMSTIKSYDNELSAKSRFDSWEYAVNVASRRILGGGFGAFAGRSDAHSIYFEVLGEHGFIGLALFLALGVFTWMSASQVRRAAEKTKETAWMGTLARMTQVSLVAYATAGAFLGMAYFDYTYNLVLIVIACKVILAKRQAAPSPASAFALASPRRAGTAAVRDEQRRPRTA